MATKIVTKNSSTASAVPTASDLVQGELAVNVADKRLFTEDNGGAIVELGTNPSGNVTFQDNGKAIFGAGSDLQIYHNATSNIIDSSAATLAIQAPQFVVQDAGGTKNMIWVPQGGSGYEVQLAHDGTTKLTTTSTGIDVTGTATMDGLTVANTAVVAGDFDGGTAATYIRLQDDTDNFLFGSNNSLGNFLIKNETADALRLSVANTGDISFYEDTGTTPKFFWDASAESLGIGTSSPTDALVVEGNVASPHRIKVSNANASGKAALIFTQGTTVKSWLEFDNATGIFDVWQYTNNPLRFGTNNTERMRIDSSGNVGIGGNGTGNGLGAYLNRGAIANFYEASDGTKTMITGTDAANDFVKIGSLSAHPVGFVVGNGERMRIDSSGDINVGCTDANSLYNNTGTNTGAGIRAGGQIQQAVYQDVVQYLNRTGNDGDIVNFRKDGTAVGSIGTNGTHTYFVGNDSAAGNGCGLLFGINTATPVNRLGTPYDGTMSLGSSGARFKDLYLSGSAYVGSVYNSGIYNQTAGDTQFWVPNVGEAVRIQANTGNLLVGTTVLGERGVSIYGDGANAFYGKCTGTVNYWITRDGQGAGVGTIATIYSDTAAVGGITVTASSTSYVTSSDQRLKENIADADDAGSKVDAIQVRKFDWKADGSHQDYGMIAQELQAVAPEAVSGDADSEEMMGVDYSKLVPMLIKEIQSLRNRVAQLEE